MPKLVGGPIKVGFGVQTICVSTKEPSPSTKWPFNSSSFFLEMWKGTLLVSEALDDVAPGWVFHQSHPASPTRRRRTAVPAFSTKDRGEWRTCGTVELGVAVWPVLVNGVVSGNALSGLGWCPWPGSGIGLAFPAGRGAAGVRILFAGDGLSGAGLCVSGEGEIAGGGIGVTCPHDGHLQRFPDNSSFARNGFLQPGHWKLMNMAEPPRPLAILPVNAVEQGTQCRSPFPPLF